MADSTARALHLLQLLQSAHLRTVPELSERLGVDERTVRRDVARLIAIGIPVESVRGRYGGYRLATGERALPIVFSSEEVVAVFLGLARALAESAEPRLAAQTALSKVRRSMAPAEAGRIGAVLQAMAPGSTPGDADPDPAVMLTLADAVTGRRMLDLRYHDRDGVPSRRTVHPYELTAHAHRWYLVALDAGAGEERTFRVDRIATVRAMPGTFAAPVRSGGTTPELAERFAAADYRWRVLLRIHDTEEAIRARLPVSVARLHRVDGASHTPPNTPPNTRPDSLPAWHRAEIHAERLDWLPSVIAGFDGEVIIDEPEELRTLVRARAQALLGAAAHLDPRSERHDDDAPPGSTVR